MRRMRRLQRRLRWGLRPSRQEQGRRWPLRGARAGIVGGRAQLVLPPPSEGRPRPAELREKITSSKTYCGAYRGSGPALISPGGISQSTKCRSPFACSRSAFPRSEIKFEARRPECARFYQANWPRQARDGAGPRSARTDSPMLAALSFFRCTALRARRFRVCGTRRACLFFVV